GRVLPGAPGPAGLGAGVTGRVGVPLVHGRAGVDVPGVQRLATLGGGVVDGDGGRHAAAAVVVALVRGGREQPARPAAVPVEEVGPSWRRRRVGRGLPVLERVEVLDGGRDVVARAGAERARATHPGPAVDVEGARHLLELTGDLRVGRRDDVAVLVL